ncbi:hypothetical protein WJT74_05960 [Sphingomicrobium sp. XHP0239]|uniref:hypothetical protein n=1 Tax=Sphingomicrobium maritimum TaxID=3133972 RepID=UPI0031CC6BD1
MADRRPEFLSTNSGADPVAFQTWRNFKEAFAPELIAQAYEETSSSLGHEVTSAIDPFGGSGTTALASQFLGVHPTTIEVNPYLADLIESKLVSYDTERLLADYQRVLQNFSDLTANQFPEAPKTFVEPGHKDRYIFSHKVASRLAGLFAAVAEIRDVRNRRLMRVLLSSIAVDLSNVVVSGKGRRYRRGWQDRTISTSDVMAAFDDAFCQAAYDIKRFERRKCVDYRLLRGDSRKLIPANGEYDMAVFSPPYPNSFDYTDVYNVELWAGGYFTSAEANKVLRHKTLRSHVQIARSFYASELPSEKLKVVAAQLDGVREELWNKRIPDMVIAYFADMQRVMSKLSSSLVRGGRMYAVVGDSRYQGIQIPVAEILIEIASPLGYNLVASEPFRSMRASPQQGGRAELIESLIVMEKR